MKKFVYDIDKLTSMQNRALDILANLRTNLINIADKIEEINNELGDHQESYGVSTATARASELRTMSNKMEDYTGEYTTNYIKLVSLYQNYEQDIDSEFRIALQDVLKNKLNKINEKNITTLDDVGYKPGSGGRISFSDLLSQGIISQAMQDVYDGYVKQLGKDNLKEKGIEDIDDFIDFIDDMGDTEYVNSADKIFSQLVDFIPIVGEIKCICDAIVGEDIITKEQLSTYERIASGVVGAAGLVGYGVLINDAVDKGIIKFTKAQGGGEANKFKNETVQHAIGSADQAQSVLDGINPKYFNSESRFGGGFYVGTDSDTIVAELAEHDNVAKYAISYDMNLSGAKVLDLTNPQVASEFAYVQNQTSTKSCQIIGEIACERGYNVIKFQSYRGDGINYVIYNDFNNILLPKIVTPVK